MVHGCQSSNSFYSYHVMCFPSAACAPKEDPFPSHPLSPLSSTSLPSPPLLPFFSCFCFSYEKWTPVSYTDFEFELTLQPKLTLNFQCVRFQLLGSWVCTKIPSLPSLCRTGNWAQNSLCKLDKHSTTWARFCAFFFFFGGTQNRTTEIPH